MRARFGLGEFTGQLFIHVIGAAGHDIVKYALDTYGDAPGMRSQTHDANSWPADLYAGLPAPEEGEEVVLWVQNSHPGAIGRGEIGMGLMGGNEIVSLDEEIAPFATRRLSVAELLPDARWPQQIEIKAGKHIVRPRYEVIRDERAFAHFASQCRARRSEARPGVAAARRMVRQGLHPAGADPADGPL